MTKLLYADRLQCTGCRICELVCSYVKEGVLNPKLARVGVIRKDDGTDKPLVCRQCGKPPCVTACQVGAIIRDGSVIKVIEEKCTGCLECVDACPFGAIVTLPARNVVSKCDLCGECVRFCPPDVLKIIDSRELAVAKHKKILSKIS